MEDKKEINETAEEMTEEVVENANEPKEDEKKKRSVKEKAKALTEAYEKLTAEMKEKDGKLWISYTDENGGETSFEVIYQDGQYTFSDQIGE